MTQPYIDRLADHDLSVLSDIILIDGGFLFLTILVLGVLSSIAIYSRSVAVPAVLVVLTIPLLNVYIDPSIIQILTQVVIIITAGYIYLVFRRRA